MIIFVNNKYVDEKAVKLPFVGIESTIILTN